MKTKKNKILILIVIIAGGVSILFYNSKSVGYKVVENIYDTNIFYPGISFQNKNKQNAAEKINGLIRDNLYGPYEFLKGTVAMDLHYDVIYMDKRYISVRYNGTYSDSSGHTGDICYGINIDLKAGELITIERLLSKEGVEQLRNKIKNKDFETEYGMVTKDETYITLDEALENQKIFDQTGNIFFFNIAQNKILVILTGFPQYGGKYSILQVQFPWK